MTTTALDKVSCIQGAELWGQKQTRTHFYTAQRNTNTQPTNLFYYMAEWSSGQLRWGKSCVLSGYPSEARWTHLARSARDFPRWSRKKQFSYWPYNKSLIDQSCWVKMARYTMINIPSRNSQPQIAQYKQYLLRYWLLFHSSITRFVFFFLVVNRPYYWLNWSLKREACNERHKKSDLLL